MQQQTLVENEQSSEHVAPDTGLHKERWQDAAL